MTPAGWYPDPSDPAFLRWWDGSMWTNHRMPRPTDLPPANAAAVDHAAISEAVVPEESPQAKESGDEAPAEDSPVEALDSADEAHSPVSDDVDETKYSLKETAEASEETEPLTSEPATDALTREDATEVITPGTTTELLEPEDEATTELLGESAPGDLIPTTEAEATPPLIYADNTPVDQGDTVFMSAVAAPASTDTGFLGFTDQGVAPTALDPALDATVVTPGGYGLHSVDPAAVQPGIAPYPGQPSYPTGAYPHAPAAQAAPSMAAHAIPLQPLEAAPSAPRRRKGPVIAAVLVIILSVAISITMLYLYFSYDGMKKSYNQKIMQLEKTVAEQTDQRDAIDTEISNIEEFLGKEAN